jgi:hypothetical protein
VTGPDDERARRGPGARFGDAVTFAWGDPATGLYGSARFGLAAGGGSALGLLFADGEMAAASTEGGAEVGDAGWEKLTVGDLSTSVEAPLRAWRVGFDGDGGGFDLRFEALGALLEVGIDDPVGRLAGLEGYEQPCRVSGTVRAGGRRHDVACLGQRGRQWGAPDRERIALSRTVSAWLGEDRSICLVAVRPADGEGHDDETVCAWLVLPSEEGSCAVLVDDARLSTTYDGRGRQRRAGIELWPEADSAYPRRAAGEAICGTSLELGTPAGGGSGLRLETAFLGWRMEGAQGVGRYDLLRRRDG